MIFTPPLLKEEALECRQPLRAYRSLGGSTIMTRSVRSCGIEGAAKGDVSKLKEAFHEDARMFGEFMGARYDVPIAELFRLSENMPADTGKYRARIISVNQNQGVASAAVAEDGSWGTVSFVDYFLLNRIAGKWKITCKTFAQTRGEPPKQ
jgi:hypothetical protein